MWYVAGMIFAQPPKAGQEKFVCESSDVLFEAANADAAYEKALAWAGDHEKRSIWGLRFVGVYYLRSLDKARPGDGTELGGRLYDEEKVWARRDELIPPKHQLKAIVWERSNRPLKELLDDDQLRRLRTLGNEPPPGKG